MYFQAWRTMNWCVSRAAKFKSLRSQGSLDKKQIIYSRLNIHNVNNLSAWLKWEHFMFSLSLLFPQNLCSRHSCSRLCAAGPSPNHHTVFGEAAFPPGATSRRLPWGNNCNMATVNPIALWAFRCLTGSYPSCPHRSALARQSRNL